MLIKSLHYFGVLFVLLFCQLASYAQVVVTSQDTTPSVSFDHSAPKPYEIGGITISGSGALDQRFLLFHVGETIDIPGDKISKTIKKLWSTGLYEDIKISVTKTMGK